MNQTEALEQRKRIVQEELECWSQMRAALTKNLLANAASPSNALVYTQALEIVVNAEGRALHHIHEAFKAE